MHIFLIGYMGVGKSTVAAALSKELGLPCAEMDAMITEQQKMPITEIFETYGEDHFRDIESALLVSLKEQPDRIISCGGGVVLRPENTLHMKESGTVIWLTAEPETVFERVKNSKDRPLLNQNMTLSHIRQMMEQRHDKYKQAADLIVATDHRPVAEITKEIMTGLEKSRTEEK